MDEPKKRRAASSPEEQENRLINLAVKLAEKHLREGTATSQEIVHFLKLASIREKYEIQKLENEAKLLEAKRQAMESYKDMESKYQEAIDAMRRYSRGDHSEDEELYDEDD